MGLFANPLSYAGYPPYQDVKSISNVTLSKAEKVNSTVRAATIAEATAGKLTNVYISPATQLASVTPDFASPPPIGSVAPNTGKFTTLEVTTGPLKLDEGANVVLGTTTGTKIGTATTQKLGFWNVTPIVQPAAATDILVALIATGIIASGASPLNLGSAALGSGTHTLSDGANIVVGSTTGTQIGTATTQKLAFFGSTPRVQDIATTDLRQLLIDFGFLATGGASPLNLNGGSLTALQTTVTAPTVAGASPVVNNGKAGIASFTDTIANGAFGTLTITNSTVSGTSAILVTPSNATANSALQVTKMVPGAGTVAITLFNAGSASTAGNNILLHYSVLN